MKVSRKKITNLVQKNINKFQLIVVTHFVLRVNQHFPNFSLKVKFLSSQQRKKARMVENYPKKK
jgi:hypothetical protein